MVALTTTRGSLRKNDGAFQRLDSKMVISHISLAILAFYGGLLLGMTKECVKCAPCQREVLQQVQPPPAAVCPPCIQETKAAEKVCPPCLKAIKEENVCPPCQQQQTQQEKSEKNLGTPSVNLRMPETYRDVFAGIGRVNREEFAKAFDVGVPLTSAIPGNKDVLILYGKDSLPDEMNSSSSKDAIPLLLSAEAAAKRCMTMKVVFVRPEEHDRCLAIMGQWPSYHVHKFMRIKNVPSIGRMGNAAPLPNLGSLDNPFRYTAKTQSYYEGIDVPIKSFTEMSYSMFTDYLAKMREASERLRPIAKAVAKGGNTVIVMLCNQGQSELFINFVCSARSRNLDTSQILLFATDIETKELAEGLGITTYYDDSIFGSVPKKAAEYYGDMDFSKMMLAKVYCVHLINMLEYNVLFQDVDIVWHKNPLEFFLAKDMAEYDMIFQDDGARIVRYEPYSPNTGFYFVRYNARTFYFLSVLIRMSDKIVDRGSHQETLNILLGDHASLYALRIKVLNRDEDYFPGGFHFHRRPDYMKDYALGKVQPYIFHMSWTENKDNKRLYLEQLGNFLVKDQCVGKTLPEIRNSSQAQDLVATCCMKVGPVICHFRDKPSKIPCKDSPPIDKGFPSFW